MKSKSLIQYKIVIFQEEKISTKIWKAQIVMPFGITIKKEKKSVWVTCIVLN